MNMAITQKNISLANFVRKVRKQKEIESLFNEKTIHRMVIEELQQEAEFHEDVKKATALVHDWMSQTYHTSKQARIECLKVLDIELLVWEIIATITMQCKAPMPLVNVASMCCHRLKMADKGAAIHTMAELIAVIADVDFYVLEKKTKASSVTVQTLIGLSDELEERAQHAQFLPPMIHKPRVLRNNRHSGYATVRGDSLILGGYQNHHDGNISLDVLNTQNRNAYEIDVDFISSVEEQPSKSTRERIEGLEEDYDNLSREEKRMLEMEKDNWEHYKYQCYLTYALMIHHGNKFYFNHKVDKRGRIYTYGYHLNPQGNEFKKATLNFAHKEHVSGVSDFLAECK
ncbi:hypothetical protein ACXNWJ_002971 [Acinetobacter baumannii]